MNRTFEERIRILEKKVGIKENNVIRIKYKGGYFSRMKKINIPVSIDFFPDGTFPFISQEIQLSERNYFDLMSQVGFEICNEFYILFGYKNNEYTAIMYGFKLDGKVFSSQINFDTYNDGINYLSKMVSSVVRDFRLLDDFWG